MVVLFPWKEVAKIQRNLGFNVISYGGGGYGENSYLGMVGFLAGLSGVSSSIVGLKREKLVLTKIYSMRLGRECRL